MASSHFIASCKTSIELFHHLKFAFLPLLAGIVLSQSLGAQSDMTRLRGILALADKGENEKALHQARDFLRSAPQSVEGLDLAGVLATRLDLLAEAHDYLLRAARIRPYSSRLLSNLGYVLIQRKDSSGALRFLRAALLLDPDSAEVAANLDQAARLFNLPERALSCAAMIRQARAERSNDRIIGFSDFSNPFDLDGPQWLNTDLPVIVKFHRGSRLILQFEPDAAGIWLFWNFAGEDSPGSVRLGAQLAASIPLSGTGPLLLTASRSILIKAWKVE